MKFGIFDHIDDDGGDPSDQLAGRLRLAELYDRLGFHAYHVAEHHGTPLSRSPSPNVFLAAAAARTTRLRLGPLVYVLPLYDPLRLAEEVATLDRISDGRLEMGVGRGASELESALFGLDTKRERFQDALAVLRKALASETFSHAGPYYRYDDVTMAVRPVQQPHPPLWTGISRPEAAEWAAANDMNVVALLPSAAVRPITDRYREAWARLGKPADALPCLGLNRPLVLAETEREALTVARRAYKRWKRNLDWLWDRKGVASSLAKVLPDEFDAFQQLGAGFAGTPAAATEFLAAEIEAAGVNYLNLGFAWGATTFEEAVRTAELFAEEVVPALG